MAVYEKMKLIIKNWQDGEYILSRGYKMDCYPEKVYGVRDKITIDGDKFIYKLWATEIVEYNRNTKNLTLYAGSWKTKITKERMNTILKLLNIPYSVNGKCETRRSSAGPWYLVGKDTKKEFDNNLMYMDLQEKKLFDMVGFIMDYESGNVTSNELIEGFQNLINSGIVWNLQGSYGRMARSLIEQG